MPITPQEAQEARDKSDDTEYAEACGEIDELLRRHPNYAAIHWRYACPYMPRTVRDRIIKTYVNAGWDVKFILGGGPLPLDCLAFYGQKQ